MVRRALARALRAALSSDRRFAQEFQRELNVHPSTLPVNSGFSNAEHFLALGFPPNAIEYQATPEQLASCIGMIKSAWQHLGRTKPHFSVLSDVQFLPNNIDKNLENFWASGGMEISVVRAILMRHGVADLSRNICVEYGCGVGRVTNAIAPLAHEIYGYDISPSHLEIARIRAEELGLRNCHYKLCEDHALPNFVPNDFFYSRLVLQHNPPPVIYECLKRLLKSLKPKGVAIFQIPTYIVGYRFEIQEWLRSDHPLDMQMHCLPQPVILSAITEAGCELMEIQQDDSTGVESIFISNLFVVRKTSRCESTSRLVEE